MNSILERVLWEEGERYAAWQEYATHVKGHGEGCSGRGEKRHEDGEWNCQALGIWVDPAAVLCKYSQAMPRIGLQPLPSSSRVPEGYYQMRLAPWYREKQ